MSDPTPIYTETLREAKRRTRKHSDERRDLLLMDERTNPWRERPLVDVKTGEPARLGGRSTGPVVHFGAGLGAPPSTLVHRGPVPASPAEASELLRRAQIIPGRYS